jgi:hypothetical protein
METINLPDVTIRIEPGGDIRITHNKTKMETVLTQRQLNQWAISQLKKELTRK